MKLKTLVGIASVLTIFTVGNIFLFGLLRKGINSIDRITASDVLFPLLYLLMCIVLLIFIVKKLFIMQKNQNDALFFIVCGVILCFALSFGATGAKAYYDKYKVGLDMQTQMSNEIKDLNEMADYYSKFISYLNEQISLFKNSSNDLQLKIDANLQMLKKVSEQNNVVLDSQNFQIKNNQADTYVKYEREYEEEEDD